MSEQIHESSRGFILYDDALVSHAREELFQPQHWQDQIGTRDAVGGRGHTFIVAAPGGDWVIRHYCRGGFAARLSRDSYIWTGLARSRPWREWHLLADLYREDLPVPQPVAAQVQPRGLWYRGDLITRRIPEARTLAERLRQPEAASIPWAAVGRCLRRFHQAGVWHADLNAHNILLDAGQHVYLIDFDRGERRPPRASWQAANLRRLYRSLSKLLPGAADSVDASWKELTAGYCG